MQCPVGDGNWYDPPKHQPQASLIFKELTGTDAYDMVQAVDWGWMASRHSEEFHSFHPFIRNSFIQFIHHSFIFIDQ